MSKEYTSDQEDIVRKILSIEKSEYYRILHVDKKATDIEIKKSYRKLAVKLHPDKNKHPQASDAFKKLAKAFEVLSDDSKRRIYDQTGYDPDSRGAGGFGNGGGAGAGPGGAGGAGFQGFPGFAAGGHPFMNAGAGPQFFDNDIFNILFNQGRGGGATFGGNGYTFSFGGPGGNPFMYQDPNMRRRRPGTAGSGTPGGAGPRGPSGEAGEQSLSDILRQFSPFLIFIIPMLINFIFNSGESNSLPKFSFEAQPALSVEKHTPRFNIPYYIDEKSNESYNTPDTSRKLGARVEKIYVTDLQNRCQREERIKEQLIQDSYGWFFPDNEKLQKAHSLPMVHCKRLRELNLI